MFEYLVHSIVPRERISGAKKHCDGKKGFKRPPQYRSSSESVFNLYNQAKPFRQDHTLRQEDYVLGLHQGKGTQEDWWKQ